MDGDRGYSVPSARVYCRGPGICCIFLINAAKFQFSDYIPVIMRHQYSISDVASATGGNP